MASKFIGDHHGDGSGLTNVNATTLDGFDSAYFQKSSGIHNRWYVNLGGVGERWYKLGTFNNNSGFVQLKGTLGSHVESFKTCRFDVTIFAREGGASAAVSIDATF